MSILNQGQFEYREPQMGSSKHHLTWTPQGEDQYRASMEWQSKGGIQSLMVHPDMRREGIATGLWEEGHRLASENRHIPAPAHSADRTDKGDAWARSIGGRLPRRKN